MKFLRFFRIDLLISFKYQMYAFFASPHFLSEDAQRLFIFAYEWDRGKLHFWSFTFWITFRNEKFGGFPGMVFKNLQQLRKSSFSPTFFAQLFINTPLSLIKRMLWSTMFANLLFSISKAVSSAISQASRLIIG